MAAGVVAAGVWGCGDRLMFGWVHWLMDFDCKHWYTRWVQRLHFRWFHSDGS